MSSPCHVCGKKCRRVKLDVMIYRAYDFRNFPGTVKEYFERHIVCRVCRDRLREEIAEIGLENEFSLRCQLHQCFWGWRRDKNKGLSEFPDTFHEIDF